MCVSGIRTAPSPIPSCPSCEDSPAHPLGLGAERGAGGSPVHSGPRGGASVVCVHDGHSDAERRAQSAGLSQTRRPRCATHAIGARARGLAHGLQSHTERQEAPSPLKQATALFYRDHLHEPLASRTRAGCGVISMWEPRTPGCPPVASNKPGDVCNDVTASTCNKGRFLVWCTPRWQEGWTWRTIESPGREGRASVLPPPLSTQMCLLAAHLRKTVPFLPISMTQGKAPQLVGKPPSLEAGLRSPSSAGFGAALSLRLPHLILLISFIAEPITHPFKAVYHAYL